MINDPWKSEMEKKIKSGKIAIISRLNVLIKVKKERNHAKIVIY